MYEAHPIHVPRSLDDHQLKVNFVSSKPAVLRLEFESESPGLAAGGAGEGVRGGGWSENC